MKLKLRNVRGDIVSDVEVRDDVFGAPMNEAAVHQVTVGQRSNARHGTAHVKNRAQVSGGGAKIRPQKHTGRARAGTIRAPQWRGGGVVFGPGSRSYRHHTTRQLKRAALRCMLSDKVRNDELIILEKLELEQAKSREMVKVLAALEAAPSVLLVADGSDESARRCARNIPRVKMLPASLLNALDLVNHRKVVMTLEAVRRAEELWGGPFVRRKSAAAAAGG